MLPTARWGRRRAGGAGGAGGAAVRRRSCRGWCDACRSRSRREYELTEQGLELAEQWLDALRARQRLDALLVGLLEGGLNAAGRSHEGAQAPSDG